MNFVQVVSKDPPIITIDEFLTDEEIEAFMEYKSEVKPSDDMDYENGQHVIKVTSIIMKLSSSRNYDAR